MTELEKKKRQVELAKLEAAISENELSIMQRKDDIKRIEDSIRVQTERIMQLKTELQTLN